MSNANQPTTSNNNMFFPYYTHGEVVKGFGRGSKQLGIPTANYPESVVESLPRDFPLGVYYGWAAVDGGPVRKMVMNVGYCPFYKNRSVSMETHILHVFPDDFYGSCLRVVILGYLRPEKSFACVDDLIAAIRADISAATEVLDRQENARYATDPYFSAPVHKL